MKKAYLILMWVIIILNLTSNSRAQSQEELIKISANVHESAEKRIQAIQLIEDQQILLDIAKNDKDNKIRIAAFGAITDQNFIAQVAMSGEDPDLQKQAFEKLSDLQLMADFIKKSEDLEYALEQIIWGKLTDQEILVDIAKNAVHYEIRADAVDRLDPQLWEDLLFELANNDEHQMVRIRAILKLSDEEVLAEIIMHSNDMYLVGEALKGVSSQDILSHIAINHPDDEIRSGVIYKLTDEELLADIAKNDRYYYCRDAAISGLDAGKWQELLADIAINDDSYIIRRKAADALDPEQWKEFLAEIVKNNNEDMDVRFWLVQKIHDPRLLVEIVYSDINWYEITEQAIDNISSQQDLEDIVKNHEDNHIRELAKSRLEQLKK